MAENVESDVANNVRIGGCTGKGFMPGQSGNPSGRPRKPLSERLIAELLKNDEAETAAIIKAWLEKAKAGDVPAIREALDRTEGKVADKQEHTGADGGPIEITVKFT